MESIRAFRVIRFEQPGSEFAVGFASLQKSTGLVR